MIELLKTKVNIFDISLVAYFGSGKQVLSHNKELIENELAIYIDGGSNLEVVKIHNTPPLEEYHSHKVTRTINTIKKYAKDISCERPEEECLIFNLDDLRKARNEMAENEAVLDYMLDDKILEECEKVLCIDPLLIPYSDLENGFNLKKEELYKEDFDKLFFCRKCMTGLQGKNGYAVKSNKNVHLCEDCANHMALVCANIIGDEDVISDIMAGVL